MLRVDVITIFPRMLQAPLAEGIVATMATMYRLGASMRKTARPMRLR
jgi:hypothetical protein